MPGQERGVRPARALPYSLHAHCAVQTGDGSFRIDFGNLGTAAAVFQVRSGNRMDGPRTYTVEPHKPLTNAWRVAAIGASDYDLSVYGPNGFFRAFKGGVAGHARANLDVRAFYDEKSNGIALAVSNHASLAANASIFNSYAGKAIEQVLEPGESVSKRWSLGRMDGWYDLMITVEGDARFGYRFAGHVETGEDSMSDPAMGGLV
jgi:phospholipase C